MERRKLATTFIVVLCSLSAYCAPLLTPKDSSPLGVVRIRESPSVASSIVGRIRYREWIRCLDPNDDGTCREKRIGNFGWFRTRSDGRDGWIRSDTVTPYFAPFAVSFIDVGSGSAALLTVGGKTVIIDGGPDPALVQEYIDAHDALTRSVPLVIVTSTDPDHVGGIPDEVARVSLREFFGPKPCRADDRYAQLLRRMERDHVRMHCTDGSVAQCPHVSRITPDSVPEVDIVVLHACACENGTGSLVVRIDIGDQRLLFTGDMTTKEVTDAPDLPSAGTEQDLVNLTRPATPRPGGIRLEEIHPDRLKKIAFPRKDKTLLMADVIVAPSHGAETASTIEFIEAVHAKFAIFLAQADRGAPQESVIARYRGEGAKVFRTDFDRRPGNDDIVCIRTATLPVDCTYENTRSGSARTWPDLQP